MKVTNYKTSKKLKELGFKAEHDYCYDLEKQLWSSNYEIGCWSEVIKELYIPAYDLETIWDFLPNAIEDGKSLSKKTITYDLGVKIGYFNHDIEIYQEPAKNLATTAARLLIKLIEDGTINLKE